LQKIHGEKEANTMEALGPAGYVKPGPIEKWGFLGGARGREKWREKPKRNPTEEKKGARNRTQKDRGMSGGGIRKPRAERQEKGLFPKKSTVGAKGGRASNQDCM